MWFKDTYGRAEPAGAEPIISAMIMQNYFATS